MKNSQISNYPDIEFVFKNDKLITKKLRFSNNLFCNYILSYYYKDRTEFCLNKTIKILENLNKTSSVLYRSESYKGKTIVFEFSFLNDKIVVNIN